MFRFVLFAFLLSCSEYKLTGKEEVVPGDDEPAAELPQLDTAEDIEEPPEEDTEDIEDTEEPPVEEVYPVAHRQPLMDRLLMIRKTISLSPIFGN